MIDSLQDVLVPSGFATLLFLAGLATVLFRRTRRIAHLLLTASATVFLLFSNGLVATLLLSPLEYAYPALSEPSAHPDAMAIVVLTAYAADDPLMPLSGKMNGSAAFRVLEAANLRSARPDCRVIVSGSKDAALIMGKQLQVLGVPADRLTIDVASNNTAASAKQLGSLIGNKPVFLVTSAGHMRRAVGVFRKHGMLPIPAPTDYWLPRHARQASWTTSAEHLQASDLAFHEYVGLAWYRLTGRI